MKVILAGHNVDMHVIEEARNAGIPSERLTPEVISAAYARISRDGRPVNELRSAALEEVEKARSSNRKIIFGMGHHSVAEHANFNFDIIGLSRLAIESLEHFRLCSFTEKSQRYITLDHDFVMPAEIKETPFEAKLAHLVKRQADVYGQLHQGLFAHLEKKFPEMAQKKSTRNTMDGWAKEDARYATLLCCSGQLGFTVNARNLEFIVKRLSASPLTELRELARAFYEPASAVAPSILLFTRPTPHDVEMPLKLAKVAQNALLSKSPVGESQQMASLVGATPGADRLVAASLLLSYTGRSLETCLSVVDGMNPLELRELFMTSMEHMEFYDSPPREYEHAQLTFDAVVSAACYGQLKRHRMMSQTPAPYDPSLGITVPPNIDEIGMAHLLREFADEAEALYSALIVDYPHVAPYALTNAHRRRVLLTLNLRDMYHFCRLREDAHAQWDIQHLAAAMRRPTEDAMPLGSLLLCGKDAFVERFHRVFNRLPGVDPAFPPREE